MLLCLQSVEKALRNLEAEVIVVDNCSEDESAALVKKHFPEVIFFQNEQNEGFSKGNNRGVKIARGEYICLLNPDTAVGESVFENALHFSENHPNFGAIGVKMIDGTGNFLPESKRNLPTPKVAFQKLIGKTDGYYANHLEPNENGKVEILAGAVMLMKKSRYLEVGGLDEDYFMYGEDIDLSYKFTKTGYENYYVGEETILHFKGESTVKDAEYANRFYGAMRLFYKKHFSNNFATDFLVNNGLETAKYVSRLRSKIEKEASLQIQKTYLVTNDEVCFLEALHGLWETNPAVVSSEKMARTEIQNALLIFDIESIPFQEILDWMEKLKYRKNQFKMLSRNFNFVIGSNQNDAKGEVLLF